MPNTPTVQLLALVAANIMLVGGALIVYRRSTGWGPAALSAFGLVLLVRTILILAVTNALSKKILATPLGAVVGYIFGRANARFPTRTPSASRSPRS
jgi:hypothetical protein